MVTLVFISVDSVVYIFGIFKIVAHHVGSEISVLCVIMKELGMLPAQVAVPDHLHHGVRLQECLSTTHPRSLALGARLDGMSLSLSLSCSSVPLDSNRQVHTSHLAGLPTLNLSHLKHLQLATLSYRCLNPFQVCFDVIASHT